MKNWWLIPLSIVVVLATVTIIWAVIIPTSSPPPGYGKECLNARASLWVGNNYTCIDGEGIRVQINREPGYYELADIEIEFVDMQGLSQKTEIVSENLPDVNGARVYVFPRDGLNITGTRIGAVVKLGQTTKGCEKGVITPLKSC